MRKNKELMFGKLSPLVLKQYAAQYQISIPEDITSIEQVKRFLSEHL